MLMQVRSSSFIRGAAVCVLGLFATGNLWASAAPRIALNHSLAVLSVRLATAPAGATANANGLQITGLGGASAPWTIVVLLTFLSLIPSLLFCVTPFARLLIVFHFLRQALGLQTTPSNQTLIGLS
jgi:flagellar biosynthesis protein FliP